MAQLNDKQLRELIAEPLEGLALGIDEPINPLSPGQNVHMQGQQSAALRATAVQVRTRADELMWNWETLNSIRQGKL